MEKYAEILRELREDNFLKQSEVAAIIKTTQQVYSRYELGINELPLRHLITLSDFYNVSTDYILGRTKNKKINK
ncbi:helix-turn-helix domain-containing protein [Anaerofustis stercorihominis]|uniref:DNA-binding helix-turn-helix protein n=2 Tax=Anaerofustis stercorihominis TaxID=214853 RepID=B1CAX7_9FIRM|nr:helix-turn-helix transcriptional regulator [Anaerofustis stercorihominis]EDS71424.1 DNA-binding helix-turn-helix protein [Anaerofustis stercorihominis DSM 17244]MCQ4795376.1 helix-turn-helix domain-containing protein [Anaerofustis stercorihominis]RGD75573.1 XRE family transcriptional regulator [Anaerofustis stercorihominis]